MKEIFENIILYFYIIDITSIDMTQIQNIRLMNDDF